MAGTRVVPPLDPTGVGSDALGVVDFEWVPEESADDEVDPARPAPDLADRLVRRFLLLCESPKTQRRTIALVRASARDGKGGRFQALVNRVVLGQVARGIGVHTSALRLELIASHLLGVATTRYLLGFEPLASMPVDDLVPLVAPGVRAVLEADVLAADGSSD